MYIYIICYVHLYHFPVAISSPRIVKRSNFSKTMKTCDITDISVHYLTSMAKDEVVCQRLSELIKKLRGDMPRHAFAKKTGIGVPSLRQYERGESIPASGNLGKLAKEAGFTVDELLNYLQTGKTESQTATNPLKAEDVLPLIEGISPHEAAKLIQILATRLTLEV